MRMTLFTFPRGTPASSSRRSSRRAQEADALGASRLRDFGDPVGDLPVPEEGAVGDAVEFDVVFPVDFDEGNNTLFDANQCVVTSASFN